MADDLPIGVLVAHFSSTAQFDGFIVGLVGRVSADQYQIRVDDVARAATYRYLFDNFGQVPFRIVGDVTHTLSQRVRRALRTA